jgi:uncharacterized protein YkwD
MTLRWQKIALGIAIAVVVVVVGFRAYDAGSPHEFVPASPTPPVAVATLQTTPKPLATKLPPAKTAAPSVAPSTPPSGGLSAINAKRSAAGVGSLSSNAVLQAEAQRFAADMASRGFFDHTTPEGVTFAQRIAATSYPKVATSENLGLTSTRLIADVVEQWMDSPGHRANLLDPSKRAVGVGTATGTYQGLTVLYVVAIFGDTP